MWSGTSNIVVAQSDRKMCELIVLLLRMEEYDVIVANDGQHALDLVYEHKPDLLITELWFPGLSGLEVGRAMQSDPELNEISIIFLTDKDEVEDRVAGLSVSNDYVTKPFAVPEFIARVKSVLRVRNYQKELRVTVNLLQEEINRRNKNTKKV